MMKAKLLSIVLVLLCCVLAGSQEKQGEFKLVEKAGSIAEKTASYSMPNPSTMDVCDNRLYIHDISSGQVLLFDEYFRYRASLLARPYKTDDHRMDMDIDSTGRILLDNDLEWILVDGQQRAVSKRNRAINSALLNGKIYAPLAYQVLNNGEPFLREISLWGDQTKLLGAAREEFSDNGHFLFPYLDKYKNKLYFARNSGNLLLELDPATNIQAMITMEFPPGFGEGSSTRIRNRTRIVRNRFIFHENHIYTLFTKFKDSIFITKNDICGKLICVYQFTLPLSVRPIDFQIIKQGEKDVLLILQLPWGIRNPLGKIDIYHLN